MKWGKRSFGGKRYDLTHLDPVNVVVTCPRGQRPDLSVRVRFGAHVFTQAWKQNDPQDMQCMDGQTPRCFCPDRYDLSLDLAGIVGRGLNGRILISPERKFVLLGNATGVTHPYSVFFLMKAQPNPPYDATIDVVSAYVRPKLKPMPAQTCHDLIDLMRAGTFAWPKKK